MGQHFTLALEKEEAPPVRSSVVLTIGVLVTLPRNRPADTFDAYLANAGMNFQLPRGRVLAFEMAPTRYHAFLARAGARLN